MDPVTQWLEHEVCLRLRRRRVHEATVGGLAAAAITFTPFGPLGAALGALVGAVGMWCIRPAYAMRFGPMSARRVRAFVEAPLGLYRSSDGPSDHPLVGWLRDHRFRFDGIVEDGSMLGAVDLYAAESQRVTVVLGRVTGSVLVLSRLTDGRLVATTDTVSAPTSGLVSNAHPGAEGEALVVRHLELLDRAVADGRGPVPDRAADVFVRWVHLERAGWRSMPSRVSSVLDLTGRAPWTRLAVRVDPGELLERSWQAGSTSTNLAPDAMARADAPVEHRRLARR